ncbi:MAG: protein kinase [Polyangiaceae bacterium]|nr:protein kinase [Polyangiaceae bacterium]
MFPPALGTYIGENYRIVAELGHGAMGIVYAALDEALERKVAIKLVRPAFNAENFREMFRREARALALVGHPNVVGIHAFGEHEGAPFIVMELIEGESLDRWQVRQTPHPNLDAALHILDQVCLGVGAIHAASTIHRDIKPSNILLDHDLGVHVSDFGLAVPSVDGEYMNEVAGTPGYIAPEVNFGKVNESAATVQSDVYSLGCVAYELLTGIPPFSADHVFALAVAHALTPVPTPTSIRQDLPPAFDAVLERALAKDPKERTPSVEALRRELLQARTNSLDPVRILVGEDDADFRELLSVVLEKEFPSAEVECVADGWNVLQAYDRKPASVLIVDLQMPMLDGMAVTERVRKRTNAQSVAIIVLTGAGGPREWQLLAALGADRFLVKPVNMDDLVSTIRRAAHERATSR